MPSLKNIFNFFHEQGRVDQVASGISGVAAAGAVATVIGVAAGMPPLALAGLAVEIGTIAIFTPLFFGACETFAPKTFAVSAAISLTGIFGTSAALPFPSTHTSQTQLSAQTLGSNSKAPIPPCI